MSLFFPQAREVRTPRRPPDVFTRGGRSLVGVAHAREAGRGVREAVRLIGGLGALGVEGKSVLVKPNVVSGRRNPTTTNPAVVRAVVEMLFEAGAKRVHVGDMSALATLSTLRNMEKTGIRRAAEEAGAEVVAFEDHDWVEVALPGTRYVEKAYVTEWVYRADRIVNVPVIKTHRSASYTICLKNFIGCTHLRQRPYLLDRSHWEELVAEFGVACRPDLNIVDGTLSMIEGGPWEGTAAETQLVIASGDRVAADALGLGVIRSFGKWESVTGKGVWEQRQLVRARELGLGNPADRVAVHVGEGSPAFGGLVARAREQARL